MGEFYECLVLMRTNMNTKEENNGPLRNNVTSVPRILFTDVVATTAPCLTNELVHHQFEMMAWVMVNNKACHSNGRRVRCGGG